MKTGNIVFKEKKADFSNINKTETQGFSEKTFGFIDNRKSYYCIAFTLPGDSELYTDSETQRKAGLTFMIDEIIRIKGTITVLV